jgi:hypothetical protein
MNWSNIVPLVVAALGLGTALFTGYLTGRRQAAIEAHKEARLAIAALTRSMGEAIHEMSWVTWKARFRDSLFTKIDVDEYERKMSAVFPALTGSLAVVAALSKGGYIAAKGMVGEIYDLDNRVAKASTAILLGQEGTLDIAALYDEARLLEETVNQRGAGMSDSVG